MQHMSQLNFPDRVTLDPDRLVELCVSMGAGGAEGLIAKSMEDLAIGLCDVESAYIAHDWPRIVAEANDLMPIAEHIGMTTFSRVLGDVAECAHTVQPVALAATLERLRRIAEKSLSAVWDMQDTNL